MKIIKLYDEISMDEMDIARTSAYFQMVRLEASCKKWYESIIYDDFMEGMNLELEKEDSIYKKWEREWELKLSPLNRLLAGELSNKIYMQNACLSNLRKIRGLPEWFDTDLIELKLKMQRLIAKQKQDRTPAERVNDRKITLILDRKEYKQEVKKLAELKAKYKKTNNKRDYVAYNNYTTTLQTKYF